MDGHATFGEIAFARRGGNAGRRRRIRVTGNERNDVFLEGTSPLGGVRHGLGGKFGACDKVLGSRVGEVGCYLVHRFCCCLGNEHASRDAVLVSDVWTGSVAN